MGTLFSKGSPQSAVIVLGGSSGGIPESRAKELAEEGFYALALAYFGAESLPKRLHRIPLEYFEKALSLLSHFVDRIGLWGTSRGAELSLLLGTLFPQKIHAIAAHVPSSLLYGAFEDPHIPVWLYQNQPLAPNAPFSYLQRETGECEQTAIRATPSFLHSMRDPAVLEPSAICVEKLECPLLLISAEDDQMWPSHFFARQIVERLQKYRSKIDYSHLSYPNVGHAPAKGTAGFHPVLKKWFAYGGNPIDNAKAATDWEKKTVSFFKDKL